MTSNITAATPSHWSESSGLVHLLRVFSIAVHPGKLALALAGIILTICWGFLLDSAWTRTGNGIADDEAWQYVTSSGALRPTEGGPAGVFTAFKTFELACILDAIESVRYGRIVGPIHAGEPMAASGTGEVHGARGTFANILLMGRGVVWMITEHYLFALLFIPVLLLIWGWLGGAICRIAAIQFARDERITVAEALQFAKSKLVGGFLTAPLIPLVLCLFVGLFLWIGGILASVPWIGDIVAGVFFFLALFGGFVIAMLIVGTVAGGSLFWPTIAVEGSDSFDAVARSFSYVTGKPLRLIWYALWLILLGSFCFLVVVFIAWLTAASTHLFVGLGTDVFTERVGVANKLTALWARPTVRELHRITGPVQGAEWIGAGLIGLWVMLLSGLVWSFLASFYFSGSTIAYFLMRRDVDGTDLGDIEMDGDESTPQTDPGAPPPPASKPDDSGPGGVSLPVVG